MLAIVRPVAQQLIGAQLRSGCGCAAVQRQRHLLNTCVLSMVDAQWRDCIAGSRRRVGRGGGLDAAWLCCSGAPYATLAHCAPVGLCDPACSGPPVSKDTLVELPSCRSSEHTAGFAFNRPACW